MKNWKKSAQQQHSPNFWKGKKNLLKNFGQDKVGGKETLPAGKVLFSQHSVLKLSFNTKFQCPSSVLFKTCLFESWRGHVNCMMQKWPGMDYYARDEHQLTRLNVWQQKIFLLDSKTVQLRMRWCSPPFCMYTLASQCTHAFSMLIQPFLWCERRCSFHMNAENWPNYFASRAVY